MNRSSHSTAMSVPATSRRPRIGRALALNVGEPAASVSGQASDRRDVDLELTVLARKFVADAKTIDRSIKTAWLGNDTIDYPGKIINVVFSRPPKKQVRKATKSKKPAQVTDLSFVSTLPGRGNGRDFWAVQTTGSYADDCTLGHRLGEEYLTYVGKNPVNGSVVLLGWIVAEMLSKAARDGDEVGAGLRIGFLHTVNRYAIAAATMRARS